MSMQDVLQQIEDDLRATKNNGDGFTADTLTALEEQAPGVNPEILAESVAEVEDQKGRSLAQGLTFGFADEMEAFVRALASKDVTYEAQRDLIRKELADYAKAKPGESLAYEAVGAVLPTVVSLFGGPGGWANAVRTVATLGSKLQGRSSIAQVAHMSGKGTALYSVGKGEDGILEDVANAPGGYLLGATIGGVVQGGGQGISEVMGRLLKTEIGSKFKAPVRDALEKMIEKTGKTAKQIVDEVKNGKLMVENDTLRAAIKALTSKEGSAAATIKDTLKPRVGETKKDLLDTMGKSIGIDWRKNLRRLYDDNDAILADAENEAYDVLFNQMNPKVNAMLKDKLMKELNKLGSDSKGIEKAIADLMRRKEMPDLLGANKNGSLKFVRTPTLKDAEFIYRMIRDLGGKYKLSGDKDVGRDFTIQANDLKEFISKQSNVKGDAYDLLTTVRDDAYIRRQGIEAYEFGVRKATAPGTDVDDLQVLIDKYKATNADGSLKIPGALEQLRLGVMRAIKHKKDTGANKMIATEDSNLQRAISMLFPEESLDDIIAKADIATGAKETLQSVNYGTTTSGEQEALKMFGAGMNSIRVGEGQDATMNLFRGALQIIRARNTDLSPQQAQQLAELVVSKDASLVQRALVDEVELNKLGAMIDSIIYGTARTTADGASKLGGTAIEDDRGDLGIMNIAVNKARDINKALTQ